MASAWYIGNTKFTGNSSRIHMRMSLDSIGAPLLRPVVSCKFSAYASIVRYGTPSVFIDELWYLDEMVARVTKTDENILEFEAFNPKGIAAVGKIMAASSLMVKISRLSWPGKSWGLSGDLRFATFRPYNSSGQYARTDMFMFDYRITNISVTTSEAPFSAYKNVNFDSYIILHKSGGDLALRMNMRCPGGGGRYTTTNKKAKRFAKVVIGLGHVHLIYPDKQQDRSAVVKTSLRESSAIWNMSNLTLATALPLNVYRQPITPVAQTAMYANISSVEVDGAPIKVRLGQGRLSYHQPYVQPLPSFFRTP